MPLPAPKAYLVPSTPGRTLQRPHMPIPDAIRTEAESHLDHYCVGLIPKHAQDKARIGYIVMGMAITLSEQRPHWKDKTIWTKSDIARARYSKTDGEWTLYCQDRNSKWHAYEPLPPPTPDFGAMLKEIDEAPTGIFWG